MNRNGRTSKRSSLEMSRLNLSPARERGREGERNRSVTRLTSVFRSSFVVEIRWSESAKNGRGVGGAAAQGKKDLPWLAYRLVSRFLSVSCIRDDDAMAERAAKVQHEAQGAAKQKGHNLSFRGEWGARERKCGCECEPRRTQLPEARGRGRGRMQIGSNSTS
jgi:hypothetical protein